MMYWYRYKEDIVITLNVTSSFHDVLVQVQRGHRHHIKCN